jgi:hypothetical protein
MGELPPELLRLIWEKLSEFLADASRLLALLLTLLLRRFLSVEPPVSCRLGVLPLPLRFSPLVATSFALGLVGVALPIFWGLDLGEGVFPSMATGSSSIF